MNDKLTTEQLQYIQTIDRTDDVASRHVRMMAAEILNFRLGLVTKPIEQNPHAALIEQCEEDKQLYPDFYQNLWQYSCGNSDYYTFTTGSTFTFHADNNYRQHPHRESIVKWQECSDEDKKRWEFRCIGKETWSDVFGVPDWNTELEYRLRPRTCKVMLQDGTVLEYHEPVRKSPAIGTFYWCVRPGSKVMYYEWHGDEFDEYELENGTIHLTQQAAEQHLAVSQAINAQRAI